MNTCGTTLHDDAATRELGRRLGRSARPSLVVALNGELGAGKTTLVKGVAEGLEIPAGEVVRSPSYFLLNTYEGGRLVLDHFDAYFMERGADLVENGLFEFVDAGHLIVVEWGERLVETLPEDHLDLRLAFAGSGRRATFAAGGPLSDAVLWELTRGSAAD
jgi:tRNA threonylcarbamoyladenosine biosynthesis protein TsaE